MNCTLLPLFSGSTGNATYVSLGGERILVDAGVSGTRVAGALAEAGVSPDTLAGILITHEHSDHIQGVGVLSRKYGLPVYATEGTWQGMREKLGKIDEANVRVLRAGEDFYMGRVGVTPFEIPHDAREPVGYAFRCEGAKLCVATDLGCVKENWLRELERSDAVLLESNHDVDMLCAGRYPYDLKKRILSRRGHLSNADAGKAAALLAERGVRRIILGHLSEENNFPELAWRTVENALTDDGFADVDLRVALWRKEETLLAGL